MAAAKQKEEDWVKGQSARALPVRAFELVVSIAIHLVGRREQVGVLMQVSCKKALAMQRFAVRSNWKLILRLCHNGAALMILYSSCPQVYIHHGIRLSYFQKLYCILRHASEQSKFVTSIH